MKVSAILVAAFILTLISGLYIERSSDSCTILRLNTVQVMEWRLGFPLQWLTARSIWQLNIPWPNMPHFSFLWNSFIADFAIYAATVTIAMVIHDRTLKYASKPNIHRIYLWSSSAILVICCWTMIVWTLAYPFWWIRTVEIQTALRVLSGLRFLLGVATIIFTWLLIKHFRQAFSP